LGKQTSQIAEELHLRATTISTYRARILSKLGMATNTELRYALRIRLID
jgi:DNA-binding NarL/FixJ family response regulator